MIGIADHVHVHACQHALLRRLFQVRGTAMGDQLGNGVPVAQHHPLKAPLLAQHGVQNEGIGRGRDAGNLVEGRHDRTRALLKGRLERGQVDVAERALRDIHRIIVLARFGRAIGRIVLGAGYQLAPAG